MLFFTYTHPYLITMHQLYVCLLNTILIFPRLAEWLSLFLPRTAVHLQGGLGSEFDWRLQEKQWQNRPNQFDPWIVGMDPFFTFYLDRIPALNKLLVLMYSGVKWFAIYAQDSLGTSWDISPKIKSIHLSATFYRLEGCALIWILSRFVTERQLVIQFPCRNCLKLVKW